MKKLTTEIVINDAIAIHGNRYDYSLVDYKGFYTNVKIICKEHGLFEQRPSDHLQGGGCPNCGVEQTVLSHQHFLSTSMKIHGDAYDYSLAEYKRSRIKVNIIYVKNTAYLGRLRRIIWKEKDVINAA